jgi:hypothetical protein
MAMLEALRVLANEKDVPYQSLLKVDLAERIAQERAPARQRRRASVQRSLLQSGAFGRALRESCWSARCRSVASKPYKRPRRFGISRGVAFGWAATGVERTPAVGGIRRHPGITRRANHARSCGPGAMASWPPCGGRPHHSARITAPS